MLRYAITDRLQLSGEEGQRQALLLTQAAGWAQIGIDFVQLREKDLAAGALVVLARQMLAALRANMPEGGVCPRLLLNARADVALAVGADGVHLTSGPGELTPGQVRALFVRSGRAEPIVSISCHTLEEVARAREDAASLILFGPVFEKRVGGQVVVEGVGLDRLREACAVARPIPVLALGGATEENAAACVATGAAGIAGIRLFLE